LLKDRGKAKKKKQRLMPTLRKHSGRVTARSYRGTRKLLQNRKLLHTSARTAFGPGSKSVFLTRLLRTIWRARAWLHLVQTLVDFHTISVISSVLLAGLCKAAEEPQYPRGGRNWSQVLHMFAKDMLIIKGLIGFFSLPLFVCHQLQSALCLRHVGSKIKNSRSPLVHERAISFFTEKKKTKKKREDPEVHSANPLPSNLLRQPEAFRLLRSRDESTFAGRVINREQVYRKAHVSEVLESKFAIGSDNE